MIEYSTCEMPTSDRDATALIDVIKQRMADKSFADHLYVLADPSSAVLGGNLKAWPPMVAAARGWTEFRPSQPLPGTTSEAVVRGTLETFQTAIVCWWAGYQRSRQLYRSNQESRDRGRCIDICAWRASQASWSTRRTVGRIESINATSRAIMLSGLDKRIPLRGSHDEWDRVAENLNLMLDRIETIDGRGQAGERQRRARFADTADANARPPGEGLSRLSATAEDDSNADRRHHRRSRCRACGYFRPR